MVTVSMLGAVCTQLQDTPSIDEGRPVVDIMSKRVPNVESGRDGRRTRCRPTTEADGARPQPRRIRTHWRLPDPTTFESSPAVGGRFRTFRSGDAVWPLNGETVTRLQNSTDVSNVKVGGHSSRVWIPMVGDRRHND